MFSFHLTEKKKQFKKLNIDKYVKYSILPAVPCLKFSIYTFTY